MEKSFEYDVFLSYSSRDRERVRRVAERLRQDDVRVWFDQFEIGPGKHIYLEIEHGIKSSRRLVLFMSKRAFDSDWVGVESGASLYRDPRNRELRFIPVLLETCEVPDFLASYRAIDMRRDSDEAYRELLAVLKDAKEQSARQQPESSGLIRRAQLFPRLARPHYLRNQS